MGLLWPRERWYKDQSPLFVPQSSFNFPHILSLTNTHHSLSPFSLTTTNFHHPNLVSASVFSTAAMLPYSTLDEASAALGRNLTVAETLWFNYSAKKSDYYLFCHNILFLFLIFSVVPLPLFFTSLWRSAGLDKYKIQPKVKLSPSEEFKCYKDVMFMFFFVVGPLQLVSYPSIKVEQLLFLFWKKKCLC